MSDSFKRWYCRECRREWIEPKACYANSAPVSITGNPLNGGNCQTCGSPEIELVEFKPTFPGLDIPRDRPNQVIPTKIHSVIPGQTANKNFSFRTEAPKPLLGKPAEDLIAAPLTLPEYREDNSVYDLSDMD